jgi:hypothetical protein
MNHFSKLSTRLLPVRLLHGAFAIVVVILMTAMATTAWAQNTWQGGPSGSWSTVANWSAGHVPISTDQVVFNTSAVVTLDFATPLTIGQLLITSNSYVVFTQTAVHTLNIGSGIAGTDFQINAGSTLVDSANFAVTIGVLTGNTADISGTIINKGATAATAHTITVADANGITFESGSRMDQDTLTSGYSFGNTGTTLVAIFKAGSVFEQHSGSNPFGIAYPSSKVVFKAGSWFRYKAVGGFPSFSGRTYANFELANGSKSSGGTSTGGNPATFDTVLISNGYWYPALTGPFYIKGDFIVNAGDTAHFSGSTNLVFTPSAPYGDNNGAPQNIRGAGAIIFDASQGIKDSNAAGVSLQRDLNIGGTLNIYSGATFNIGANTLTLNNSIAGTPTNLVAGPTSSITVAGTAAVTIPSSVAALNNLTLNNTTGLTLSSPLGVGGTLYLTAGTLTVGGNLTMGNGSTISRSGGTLSALPTLAGTVNVAYTGGSPLTTGVELPTSPSALSNLTLSNTGGVTLNASATVNGVLSLGTQNLTTSSYLVTIANGGSVTRSSGYIIGNEDFAVPSTPATKTFDVGTVNGYSPATMVANSGTGDFQVTPVQGDHSPVFVGNEIKRYWTLTNNGITNADFTFQYLVGDVTGTEANYSLRDYHGGAWTTVAGSTVDVVNHIIAATGMTSFSDFLAAECPTITLTAPPLPNGNQGAPYNQTITASGGNAPYSYAITSGHLPVNLSMSGGGAITGTPTVAGDSTFTVTVTDNAGCTASQVYSLTVTGCPVFTFTPLTLPSSNPIGTVYDTTIVASGGAGGYTYAVTSGTLPGGLTLDGTGLLHGTTTTAGVFTFTVTATDANICTGYIVYKVVVCGPITLSSLPNGNIGIPYSQTITVTSGGTPGYAFSLAGGTIPSGLTLHSNGKVDGTPTANGDFSFTVQVTDTNGCTDTHIYGDTITCPTITVVPLTMPNSFVGKTYNQTAVASGGKTPYTYSVSAGSLPLTLSLNPATGAISGTLTAGGTYNFTITATDSNGCTGLQAYTVVVGSFATFRVANTGIPQMNWDSTGTWIVDRGTSITGLPRQTDSVILDNKYHSGSYTINAGIHAHDTCRQLTMGYPGNANTLKLSLPVWGDSINRKLVIGDSLPGNYDLDIEQGGYFDMRSRWSGSYPFDMTYYHSPDSIRMHAGSYMYWGGAGYQTMFFNLNRGFDGDYGTIELDVPHNFGDFNWGSQYVLPNLILSNTQNAPMYFPYGSGVGVIKGNFTINPGVVDSLALGAGSYIWVGGNIVNNGTSAIDGSMLVMAETSAFTTPQTISGTGTLRLKAGMAVANPSGVTVSQDLHVEGGTVQTNGTIGTLAIPAVGALNLGTSTMYLNPAGSLNEGAGVNPIQGTITATRKALTTDQPFGNIGFEIATATVAPDTTTVIRKNGTALTGNGHSSIKRYYDVTAKVNTALGAAINVSYAPGELNGITESGSKPYSPILQKSPDAGTTWSGQNGTVNAAFHQMVASGVQSLSYRWTGADVNSPLYITHTLVVDKLSDADANPATKFDQTGKQWWLYLYRDTVSAGHLINSANPGLPHIGVLTTPNLESGKYIAVEADSIGWLHLGVNEHGATLHGGLKAGNIATDTVSFIDANPNSLDSVDFINHFGSNSIVINKLKDNDGNFNTTIDRVAKPWHLEVHQGTASGPIVGQTDAGYDSLGGVAGGTYVIVEADSTGWVNLGYVVGVVPTASNTDTVVVNVSYNQVVYVTLVNAPPIYSQKFRTFSQRAVGFDVDNKNVVNKFVVAKPDKDQFDIKMSNDSTNITDLHVEFGSAIDTVFPLTTIPPSTVSQVAGSKYKKWNFVFNTPITTGDSVHILGFAWTNKDVKISKFFWTRNGTQVGKNKAAKDYALRHSQLCLPMPNRVNALAATYPVKGPTGLIVGKNEKSPSDSSKYYGWFQAPDYKGVLTTLYKKAQGQPVSHAAYPFNFLTSKPTKAIVGQQKSLPPTTEANSLMANMIALRLNIGASDDGFTTPGLGDLIYSDPTTPTPGIDGLSLRAIAHLADSVMMGWLKDSTNSLHKPVKAHEFNYAFNYNQLDSIISMIDSTFEGAVDTVHFSTVLQYKGTKMLISIPYLHADPNAVTPKVVPPLVNFDAEIPMAYKLYQNYPNPFNPTTTIQFDLPEASIVTLKIYNILGQEIATLLDRQQMDLGQSHVQFNASRLASGVYFYRLTTSALTNSDDGSVSGQATVNVKKMLLIK